MEEFYSDLVSEVQRERVFSKVIFLSFCDLTYFVQKPVKPLQWMNPLSDVMDG